MSVSFSAEMSDQSVYQVVCACGAYKGNDAASFKSARFAADLFNANASKSYADCMSGCESEVRRYYVEEMCPEVNMSNANSGLFFGMMSVDVEDRVSGSMDAAEFLKKIQDIGKFAIEGSYVSEKVAQLSEVAMDAMSKGVKVSWG